MGFHGGGWFGYVRNGRNSDEPQKPQVTWSLLKRVLTYALPYRLLIVALLITILITTGLGLLTPLIFRDLIDNALPNENVSRLNLLALALIAIPVVTGAIRVIQRRLPDSGWGRLPSWILSEMM
jgi:ATP-binding cassette subfamily B protein